MIKYENKQNWNKKKQMDPSVTTHFAEEEKHNYHECESDHDYDGDHDDDGDHDHYHGDCDFFFSLWWVGHLVSWSQSLSRFIGKV